MYSFILYEWRISLQIFIVKFNTLQEICTTVAVLFFLFFFRVQKPPLYVAYCGVFFGTAAIALVFCDILQQRDIKPPQYICFSGVNLDIVPVWIALILAFVFLFCIFFFFYIQLTIVYLSTVNSILFMGPTVLFTHLKIISLQCFQFQQK